MIRQIQRSIKEMTKKGKNKAIVKGILDYNNCEYEIHTYAIVYKDNNNEYIIFPFNENNFKEVIENGAKENE